MKCPYTTACDACGHKNEEICNTCSLIFEMADCIADINTSGMSGDVNCSDCIYYGHGVRPTGATPVLAWIIEKLTSIFGGK